MPSLGSTRPRPRFRPGLRSSLRSSLRVVTTGLLLLLSLGVASPSPAQPTGRNIIAGYLPEYRIQTVTPAAVQGLTDLIFFGARIDAGGQLDARSLTPRHVAALHRLRDATGCRLLLCVGGWGRSDGFAAATSDDAAIDRLVQDLDRLCDRHALDGIDYDWEHPADAAEMQRYAALVAATAAAFESGDRLVTLAQAPWQDLGAATYAKLDRVHMMSYDHDFPQATIEKTIADVDRLIGRGCPPAKLVVGVPFYGRNAGGQSKTYRELVTAAATDDVSPRVDQIDGYAFNGVQTLQTKIDLVRRRELGGLMIWEITQDVAADHPLSLMRPLQGLKR